VAVEGGVLLDGLVEDARVPLDRIRGELAALEAAAEEQGRGLRHVHRARHRLARHLGDGAVAEREFELWFAAPRDLSSGCAACEQAEIADRYAERGDDRRAFETWEPLFGGRLFCDREPHRALARSLVPLVRLGRAEQAREHHLRGYRIARRKAPLSSAIGEHIEFCALTGNAARGLELLAEHGDWLAAGEPTLERMGFLGGVEVLLRVLSASGYDDVPFAVPEGAVRPLGELYGEIEAQLSAIVAEFDGRNGTTAVGGRLVQRRSRQPFLSSLPLPARTSLPRPSRRPAAIAQPARRSLDDLVAEARRLTAMWHPGAVDAWRNVAQAVLAGGQQPLAEEVQVELDEQMLLAAGEPGVHGSANAAEEQHDLLLEISARYRELGLLGPALRAASRAAFALSQGGRVDAAASEQSALRLAAADAMAGREITAREYMAVRIRSGYQKFNTWLHVVEQELGAAGEADQGHALGAYTAVRGTGGSETMIAAAHEALGELNELIEECRRFASSLHGAAAAGMAAEVHLGCGETDAAERNLRLSVQLYLEGGAPWSAASAELNLSQIARSRGDLAASEQYARAAVEHNLDADLRGPAAMLLAEAIWLQDGREAEAVAPALAAAAAFGRQQDGAADEARAQLRAAEALAVSGRDAEAAALFEPALRVLDSRWGEEEWKPVIAQAARTYGNCLMAVGEPRAAAELLLNTAERVKDWPNQVPHAMIAADAAAALERAGRPADAAAAFERAAELWQAVGEPLVRVKCLRSAAWLVAGEDLDASLRLMDGAGRDLVAAVATAPPTRERELARYELAETHMQRARIVLNLADDGALPAGDRDRLLDQAYQEIVGSVSGLWKVLRGPLTGLHFGKGAGSSGGGDADPNAERARLSADHAGLNVDRAGPGADHAGLSVGHAGPGADHAGPGADVGRGGDSVDSGVRSGTGPDTDSGTGPDSELSDTVLERLAFAGLVSARLEGVHLGRAVGAAAGLRKLARELEDRQRPELARPLVEYADELHL